jgi:hypothetical protein
MKDRLKKKLKAKKLRESNQPKHLFPFIPKRPPVKEYEMPEEYRQNLLKLTGMIEDRDRYAREIPHLPPEKRAEAKPALANLTAAIDRTEQMLADEYEQFQAERRREDAIDEAIAAGMEATEKLYIIVKHQTPHLFDEFHKIVVQDMTPEEEQEFYDKIAVLEATMLDDILSGKE